MLADLLRGFIGFEDLPAAALAALADQSRRVRLPPGRWLVRPGRTLTGHYYLLTGRVRLLEGGRARAVTAGSEPARRPVYPGCAGVETLTAATFLRLEPHVLEQAWAPEGLGMPEVDTDPEAWQRRFLASPLMQRLAPADWQRVLRAMTLTVHDAGVAVIVAGEAGDHCYVLAEGEAEIVDPDGARLARVEPGQLFGEDALVTGCARNASVIMTRAGATVRLAADDFQRWLLDAVVPPLAEPGGRRLVALPPATAEPAALRVSLGSIRRAARALPRTECFAVAGGSRRERFLAAFLLAEQGLDARPLAGS